jgi:hypothetical protein
MVEIDINYLDCDDIVKTVFFIVGSVFTSKSTIQLVRLNRNAKAFQVTTNSYFIVVAYAFSNMFGVITVVYFGFVSMASIYIGDKANCVNSNSRRWTRYNYFLMRTKNARCKMYVSLL